VRIRNANGLVYRSEELYWDGSSHELYSNVFSRVITPERALEGTYFRSNENMSRYIVSNSKGSFQSEDITGENKQADHSAPVDTAKVDVPKRQAATKRAANHQNTLSKP
jgi:hypothetical protein